MTIDVPFSQKTGIPFMVLTTKQLASNAAVSIETIRFYEREGLIDLPPRTAAGYRQFPEAAVVRIRFIKRAQSLGFSLPEIKGLLALRLSPDTTPADIRAYTSQKIETIEEKIQHLQYIKNTLLQITEACHSTGQLSDCPILDALEQS